MAEIAAVTYGTLHTILPTGRKALYQKANSSNVPVYRVKVVEAAVLPGGTLALREEENQEEEDVQHTWSTIEEPLDGPDDTQQIVDRAVAGKSFCVLRAAGTGKSVTLRAVKKPSRSRACSASALR